MSDSRKSGQVYFAPGASGIATRLDCPGQRTRRIAPGAQSDNGYAPGTVLRAPAPNPHNPDDHVVEPETGQEMIDGRMVQVSPAEWPHADCQFDLSYVLRGNIASGYTGSTELLTRVSESNDFATDVCIRKRGSDANGHRHLEELSFEIKHVQSEASLKKRARELIQRGVRRVFAIWVKRGVTSRLIAGPVKEWSAAHDDWVELDNDGYIEDRCLGNPIKVRAFIDEVEASNTVARALVTQRNPVIVEARSRSYDRGKSDGQELGTCLGLREGIRALCQAFGIELTAERDAELDARDLDALRALLRHLRETRSWPTS